MSDAIEARLRRMNDELIMVGNDYSDVLLDAASEIEALRAQVAQHEANANRALAECQALVAKIADCQAVIRHKGHDADCPARRCRICWGFPDAPLHRKPAPIYADEHRFQSGPCSDTCGHDRTTEA